MTTQIIVNAHCGGDKEVKITVPNGIPAEIVLQNGETKDDIYVFDDIEISVKEVKKS